MRQLIRRLRICDSGAGLVEYTLLIGLLALGLAGVLTLYRGALGGITNRTAVTISKQASRGYAGAGGARRIPIGWRPPAGDPEPSDPEPSEDPDSTSAAAQASN